MTSISQLAREVAYCESYRHQCCLHFYEQCCAISLHGTCSYALEARMQYNLHCCTEHAAITTLLYCIVELHVLALTVLKLAMYL
jgi:hypothetical protein